MGVLYEHWRTDLNECFYVGISWSNEKTRPYEMDDRSEDHKKIQKEVNNNNEEIKVKIIECNFLSKEELCQLEIMQIAYWKNLIGDRLVNKTKGGTGIHIDWNEDRRKEHKQLMSKHGDYIKQKKIKWWSIPENKEKTRKSLIEFYKTKEGKETIKRSAQKSKDTKSKLYKTEEYKQKFKRLGKKVSENRNSEKWRIRNPDFEERISKTLREFAKTEEGKLSYQKRKENLSNGVIKYYNTAKGRAQAIYQAWWNSNVRFQNYWGA